MSLWPLFFVSLAAVGYETALTRYFAVAKWSEYGYWVISIAMAGFALSGVVVALLNAAVQRRAAWLRAWLPVAMIVAAAAGFHLTALNPFNPLALQNAATWRPELWNIAGYYACLLPFFFFAGLFVSLMFVTEPGRAGIVYAFDLTGAGAGALLVLALMSVLHPFLLVPVLLVPLALAVPRRALLAGIVALAAGEALLLGDPVAHIDEFKSVYPPLHVEGAQVVAEHAASRGYDMLLDDFTERVDTDVSNDAGLLGTSGPPRAFGLYRDGVRIGALPMPGRAPDVGYAKAALDGLPYELIPGAQVRLIGVSGGFRVGELLALGAGFVDATEPDPVLRRAVLRGMGPSPAMAADKRETIGGASPLLMRGDYDIVDISADFLDVAEANASAFTVEALAADLAALRPGGLVSVPISIRDFPVYATRMLGTVREALLRAGVSDPAAHVVVYRSAWSVRILLSVAPVSSARIAAIRAWCDARSFDVSYYPGIDPAAARATIYNDLPAVSFASGEVAQGGPADSIADEARAMLDGAPTPSADDFNLAPITLDRPFFYAVLDLSHLRTVLARLEILPQAEIGALVNVAVLAQAVVIAALVLVVPLLAPGRVRGAAGVARPVLYFAALGLGFLFLELFLIDKAGIYLADRASAFALVLTGMLIFSGLGSLLAARAGSPHRAVAVCVIVVVAFCAAGSFLLQPAVLATLGWPWGLRAALVLVAVAPVSVALGMPFPLGLSRQGNSAFLPWAWALNGAFSVVATPLANLVARQAGFHWLLICAAMVYLVALVTFPLARKQSQWQQASLPVVR